MTVAPTVRRAALARRFGTPAPAGAVWAAGWVLAVLAELAALAPIVLHHVPFTPVDLVFRLVGFSFACCGLLTWRRRPDSRVGLLMLGTGGAFLLPPLLDQLQHPAFRTAALWLPDLWVLPFVTLLLTFLTGGRLRAVADQVVVGVVAAELVVLAPLYLMVAPLPGNLFLVADAPGVASGVDAVQKAVFVAVPLATAAIVAARWRATSPAGRRALLPAVAGTACLLLFAAMLVVDLAGGGRQPVLLWCAACSIVTVPLAFLVGLLRSRLARGAVADLFRGLHTLGPAEIGPALARALGDPGLVVVDGEPPVPGPGRSLTRAGSAVLVHDAALDDDPELVEAAAGAAAVVRENVRLHTEAATRTAELQASRSRLVAAADAERRRIERDLHDGAQQRLITLGMDLARIGRRIHDDPADAELLVRSAGAELARSLAELRELARGIHPAVVGQGVEAALESVALRSTVPVTVDVEPGPSLPEPVVLACWFVASEALANVGRHARARTAVVRVRRAPTTIEIADDGVGGADPAAGTGLRGLADRVGALGGTLEVGQREGGGTVVRARLPG